MTDLPYTDDDLRAEAARQLASAAEDPDFMGIGEQMEGSKIPSRGDFQWDQLDDADYDAARHSIDDLITNAADVSEWAVALGVTGLKPGPVHAWTTPGVGYEAAIQIATSPEITDEARERLSVEIRRAVGVVVCRVLGRDQVEGGAL